MSQPPQPQVRETAARDRERAPDEVGEAPIAGRDWRSWARNLGVAAAAGLFLALSGAMETGQAPLATRLVYWLPLMIGGAFVGAGMSSLVSRVPRAGDNPWLFGALLTLAISIPATAIVWAYTNLIFQQRPIPLGAAPVLFGPVLVISAAMTAIMMLVNRPGRATHAAPAGAAPVRFLERLPAKLRGAVLYAVSAEDHYLRLHTSKGGDLILMRLSDAIGELEGLEGAQTHRSWWVARDAVETVRRDGDRVTLLLKGGAEAPVSRPNVRALREAGWF